MEDELDLADELGDGLVDGLGGKATLEYALRPHAVSREEILRRYRPVALMVRQILGVIPHAMSYLDIWPPAFITYSVLVPSLLDIPRCDLGRGISPDLRSLVLYVSSRSYDCAYCSAHAAGMGTIFKGPGGSLSRNARALLPDAEEEFDAGERAAIEYATAIAQIPTPLSLEHRLDLARNFDERAEESIVLAATLMGFLNCAIDSLGVVLERRLLQQSQQHLAASAWRPNKNYVEEFDAELVAADPVVDNGESLGKLELARVMMGVVAFDRAALRGIEKRPDKLYAQLERAIGFVPGYVRKIERSSTKRVLSHALIERMQAMDGPTATWLKYTLGFVAAKACNNPLLAAHFAYGAMRCGATPDMLLDALESDQIETRESAAYALARAAASPPVELGDAEISRLMICHSPAGIIELVVTLGVFTMLHRYTSTYPAAAYEPQIAAFVHDFGEALGLPEVPFEDALEWDEAVARARGAG